MMDWEYWSLLAGDPSILSHTPQVQMVSIFIWPPYLAKALIFNVRYRLEAKMGIMVSAIGVARSFLSFFRDLLFQSYGASASSGLIPCLVTKASSKSNGTKGSCVVVSIQSPSSLHTSLGRISAMAASEAANIGIWSFSSS